TRRSPILELEEEHYTEALLAELRHYAAMPAWNGRRCSSVFFGGGTPSLFSARSVGRILDAIFELFPDQGTRDNGNEYAEVTLEANPGTIQEQLGVQKLHGFRKAGINRASLGCQSFSSEKLKKLGRLHGTDDIFRAVENLKSCGFSNFNLDLMFGVHGETIS